MPPIAVGIGFAGQKNETDRYFLFPVMEGMGKRPSDRVLDLRGWSCPWCILKAKSWLVRMKPGQVLKVLSTDPTVQKNFPRVLECTEDRIIHWEHKEDYIAVLIRRGAERTGP